MTFLAPVSLFLAAVAVPVVLLYFLRLERPRRAVASTLLWRQVQGNVQANAPWQRLRPSLLLLLQLLAIAALVLALAQPAHSETKVVSGDLIVVVDESYGMQARDVAPSRFAQAIRRAHTLADELGPGHVMTVIGMSAQPHLALTASADRDAIGRAIDALRVTDEVPNVPAALSLAGSLARATTRVVVLTSRDSGMTGPSGPISYALEIDRFGGRMRDLAITGLRAARSGDHVDVFVRLHNYGPVSTSSDLDLTADGRLADVRPITVGAGHDLNLIWTQLPATVSRLGARLTAPDDMTGDKVAAVRLSQPVARRVTLVSGGDYFLETALRLDTDVRVRVIPPELAALTIPRSDLVIFEGALPTAMPDTAVLLINPPRGRLGPVRFTNTIPVSGLVSSGGSSNPIGHTDFTGVALAQAREMTVPRGWAVWARGAAARSGTHSRKVQSPVSVPTIAAGSIAGHRVAVLAFDPAQSTWPLQLSYPVAVHDLVTFLADIAAPSAATNPSPPRLAPAQGPRALRFGRASVARRRQTQSSDLAWTFALAALVVLSVEWWYGSEWVGRRRWVRRGRDR